MGQTSALLGLSLGFEKIVTIIRELSPKT